MPEKALKKINSCILPEWKVCFLAALFVGLFAHFYKITNWLPNWDSLVYGNTFIRNNQLIKVDNGGALKYRAQGNLKENFGFEVEELFTLVSSKNPTSKDFYKDITEKELVDSIKKVVNIPDDAIKELVQDKELANILLNRKKYLQLVLRINKKIPYLEVEFGKWMLKEERGSDLPDLWLTITRSAPLITKVPVSVMRGRSPMNISCSLMSSVSLL